VAGHFGNLLILNYVLQPVNDVNQNLWRPAKPHLLPRQAQILQFR
jgi:hypothetical protein